MSICKEADMKKALTLLTDKEIERIAPKITPHLEMVFRTTVIDLPWTKYFTLRVEPEGEASYHSHKEGLVVLGLKGIVQGYFVESEWELLQACYYTLSHECAHIRYTQNEAYSWGIQRGMEIVLETVGNAVGEKNFRFRKDADFFMFGYKLYRNYNLNLNIGYLQQVISDILNILCDGRINRITASRNKSFDEQRLYVFHKAWLQADIGDMDPDVVLKDPFQRVQVLTNSTLSVAKWHRPLRGFIKAFGGTVLDKELQRMIPYAFRADVSRSTREMVKESFLFFCRDLLAPRILECLFYEREMREKMEALGEIVKKILKDGESPDAPEWMKNLAIGVRKIAQGEGQMIPGSPMNLTEEDPTDPAEEEEKEKESFRMPGKTAKSKENSEEKSDGGSSGEKADDAGEPEESGKGENPSSQKGPDTSGNEGKDHSDAKAPDGSKNQSGSASQKSVEELSKLSEEEERKAEEELREEMEKASQSLKTDADRIIGSINTALKKADQEFGEEINSKQVPLSKETVKKATALPFTEVYRKYELTERLPEDIYREGLNRKRALELMACESEHGTIRYMTQGKIDTQNIWRFAVKKFDGFKKDSVKSEVQGCVYILLDNSGSMMGGKKRAACRELSIEEVQFSGLMPLKIVAFDVSGRRIVHEVIKDWDEKKRNSCSWNFLKHGRDGSGNADEHDIRIATQELLLRSERRKLLVVLSDGTPDNPSDCKRAISEARGKGISVFGIYFEEGEVSSEYASQFREMYQKDYVCCPMDEIGKHLDPLLKSFFKHSLTH